MISMHIPTNGKPIDIKSEIGLASNIKDKSVRNNTVNGLQAIQRYL